MIEKPDYVKTIAILAPSLAWGEYYRKNFNLEDLPGVCRYRVITPSINLVGTRINSTFDPENMIFDPQYQEWIEENVKPRII